MKIKGKDYITVNERLKYFRSQERYKGWRINTEILHLNEKEVVMKAVIFDPKGVAVSDGIAHEVKGSTNVNNTSHIENCQTSAIGRALGTLGIGIDTSVSSADEVMNAQMNSYRQSNNDTAKKINELKTYILKNKDLIKDENLKNKLKEIYLDKDVKDLNSYQELLNDAKLEVANNQMDQVNGS